MKILLFSLISTITFATIFLFPEKRPELSVVKAVTICGYNGEDCKQFQTKMICKAEYFISEENCKKEHKKFNKVMK